MSGHSHKLIFVPVATYPLVHELMLPSKCSVKQHGLGEVVSAECRYVTLGKLHNFSWPRFSHL